MATSRSENLGSRFARYLGSTRNIVGSVAALGALGATVPTGVAGPVWPLVVAGTYGIGALLSPRERASFAPSGFASTRAQAAEHHSVLGMADLDGDGVPDVDQEPAAPHTPDPASTEEHP